MNYTQGKWSEITNHLTAAEVIDSYTCTVWIDGRMVHLTAAEAIDVLRLFAE